jgi:hypothetical protein
VLEDQKDQTKYVSLQEYCQGLISEHLCSDFRPARIVSDTRLSTAASDSHRLHYITFYPYFCILSPLLSPSPYPLHVFSRPWCGERTLSVLPSHQASSSVISILSRLYISSPITPDRSYHDRLWALSKRYVKTHTSNIISKPHLITHPLIARPST